MRRDNVSNVMIINHSTKTKKVATSQNARNDSDTLLMGSVTHVKDIQKYLIPRLNVSNQPASSDTNSCQMELVSYAIHIRLLVKMGKVVIECSALFHTI
jgi:hypothetical protein